MSRKAEFWRVLGRACREPWGPAWLEGVHTMTVFVHSCLSRGDTRTADLYLDLVVSNPDGAEALRIDETCRVLLEGVELGGDA